MTEDGPKKQSGYRESQQEFTDLIVNNVEHYAFILIGMDETILWWNRGAENLLGWKADEIVGKPSAIFFTEEDQEAGIPAQELNSAREEGRAIDDRWHVRKDGTRFWGSGLVLPLHDDSNELCGFVKIMQDRTDERMKTKELEESVACLETLSKMRSRLINELSHDIRTPLTGIITMASMLGEKVPEELQEMVQIIERSAENMTKTLNSILARAQLEANEFFIEQIDVRDEIDSVIAPFCQVATSKGLEFEVLRDNRAALICIDRIALQRILNNLLNNSFKFTNEGGVYLRVERKADDVIITVADTGMGISEQFLPKIFDEFAQAPDFRSVRNAGSGLGLTIVKRLVEAQGGTISAHSEEGVGTRFVLRFPYDAGCEDKRSMSTEGPLSPAP
ncbi:MAG: PAS domain-containing sensor histidine kinase [Bradymonadaceae bacterium]